MAGKTGVGYLSQDVLFGIQGGLFESDSPFFTILSIMHNGLKVNNLLNKNQNIYVKKAGKTQQDNHEIDVTDHPHKA